MTEAVLALADGKIFRGKSFGAEISADSPVCGEVVFNTSMTGYQEILTDPSYAGQIMCFTSAQIGNVGCNSIDIESAKVHTLGVIAAKVSSIYSNYRAECSLSEYLKQNNVPGLSEIDTRALVQHLREQGSIAGAIATGNEIDAEKLIQAAKNFGSMEGKNYVKQVSCEELYQWTQSIWDLSKNVYGEILSNDNAPHIVAVDCGIKYNILRLLTHYGFRVTVVPAYTDSEEILGLKPDGVFLSNGPGDPATLTEIVQNVKNLLGKVPVFGICLGHQILSQALGGKTFKLKFGHRGGNHPVSQAKTNKVEITCQNHGFAVDADSLDSEYLISHANLNDGTVEGLEVEKLKCFSVQYHPESSPGPQDAEYLFTKFYQLVNENA